MRSGESHMSSGEVFIIRPFYLKVGGEGHGRLKSLLHVFGEDIMLPKSMKLKKRLYNCSVFVTNVPPNSVFKLCLLSIIIFINLFIISYHDKSILEVLESFTHQALHYFSIYTDIQTT